MKFGYARVSTGDQSLDSQIDALKAAGAERIYHDIVSGMTAKRTGFDDLIEHLRSGDSVIVYRLDRLARSTKHLIELADMFEARGVQLVLLNEGIDTTTTTGKLFFQIFSALAEFERNLIVERTTAGLAAARARGRTGGRKPVLTDEKKATIDALIAAAKAKGEDPSWPAISRAVGASSRTVRRYAAGQYADSPNV